MEHPPGIDTRACPLRAKIGPITTIEARILLTYSYGAVVFISEFDLAIIFFASWSKLIAVPR